ncbi:transposase [Limobrevibacterium gyesilva]|nr:transposase [Limobrevibacterium gyesilva]
MLPDDIDALRAALAAKRAGRREAEARASGAEAMVAHLKLLIAKLKHDRFGASPERGRKLLDQMELELEELEAAASEDATVTGTAAADTGPRPASRRRPVRGPLPAHLPRERAMTPAPSACPCSVSPARNSSATCRLNAALWDRCFVMASILRKPSNEGQTKSLILSTPRGALHRE